MEDKSLNRVDENHVLFFEFLVVAAVVAFAPTLGFVSVSVIAVVLVNDIGLNNDENEGDGDKGGEIGVTDNVLASDKDVKVLDDVDVDKNIVKDETGDDDDERQDCDSSNAGVIVDIRNVIDGIDKKADLNGDQDETDRRYGDKTGDDDDIDADNDDTAVAAADDDCDGSDDDDDDDDDDVIGKVIVIVTFLRSGFVSVTSMSFITIDLELVIVVDFPIVPFSDDATTALTKVDVIVSKSEGKV